MVSELLEKLIGHSWAGSVSQNCVIGRTSILAHADEVEAQVALALEEPKVQRHHAAPEQRGGDPGAEHRVCHQDEHQLGSHRPQDPWYQPQVRLGCCEALLLCSRSHSCAFQLISLLTLKSAEWMRGS